MNVTKRLLKKNPNLIQAKSFGVGNSWTALQDFANRGRVDVVLFLINSGADVNATNNQGMTALHLSILFGHKNVVEYLVENNADINLQDENGRTPLHWSVNMGRMDIVELLLRNGAIVNVKNHDGKTPLELAEKRKSKKGDKKVCEVFNRHM